MDNLPELITGAQAQGLALERYWLDASIDYPEPHYLLEYNGVGFSPLGGIQALSGQKKNGKTHVLTQLMAAILGSGSERVSAKLPGLQVRQETREFLESEPSVLYVDTEMELLNSAKVLRRVHWLCGWDMMTGNDRFRILWLRTVESPTERFELIKKAIDWMRPTAVFIDGLRDIVKNFNDNEESSLMVSELMKMATEYNCCIWNVLHANPRPMADEDGKMRGHLGTELGNKVSDTFISVKKKTANGVTFTVKQQDARGKDVDDWSFEITDDAGGLGIPRILGAAPAMEQEDDQAEAWNIESVREWLTEGQNDIIWPATAIDIKKLLKSLSGQKKTDTLQSMFVMARNRRLILPQAKEEMSKGQRCPKYHLNEDEIIVTHETDLPF